MSFTPAPFESRGNEEIKIKAARRWRTAFIGVKRRFPNLNTAQTRAQCQRVASEKGRITPSVDLTPLAAAGDLMVLFCRCDPYGTPRLRREASPLGRAGRGAQGKRALHFTKIYSFSSVLVILTDNIFAQHD